MLGMSTGVMGYNRTARRRQQIFWAYDATDPAAITIRIPALVGVSRWIEWTFSRAMLGDAYLRPQRPQGSDIHIMLSGERLVLRLTGSTGHRDNRRHSAVFSFPAGAVWEFLLATHKIVPPCRHNGRCGLGDNCFECDLISDVLTASLASMSAE